MAEEASTILDPDADDISGSSEDLGSVKLPFSYRGQSANLEIWLSRPIAHSVQGTSFSADISANSADISVNSADISVNSADISANGPQIKAVVKMFPYVVTRAQKKLLADQAKIWAALDHPHILPVFGVCSFGFMQTGLVSPWMQHGNMSEFLRNFADVRRLLLIAQAASGLQYLHQADIVHGNLKCANVLISDSRAALLADFGWSMLVEQAGERTAVNIRSRETVAFEAPELLTSAGQASSLPDRGSIPWMPHRTTFTDCFAFGMLIYETYAGYIPWMDVPRHERVAKVIAGDLPPRDYEGEHGVEMSNDLWELCTRCWSRDPLQRPQASAIYNDLTVLDEGGLQNDWPTRA